MKSKKITYFLITFLTFSTFLTFIPSSQGELKLSGSKIFNGLYANYSFIMGTSVSTGFNYVHHSGDIYNVTWWQNASAPASWQEDLQTRLTSNVTGIGTNFGSGVHTPVWIFDNTTLGDSIPIAVDGIGDHTFNVSGEDSIFYPGFGNLNVWVLEDLFYPLNLVLYEKSTGILLNATFQWFGGIYTLTLTDTNMFAHYQPVSNGIPGYSLVVFLPITILITILILKKRKIKL
ncbi:MAG: Loki-CTERM sorting domain-containing protein [Promethearchaeota archaeon]